MKFTLNNLAIGSYDDALAPPSDITALLNVVSEKDVETKHLYHKVPNIDMQPIPPNQMKEAVKWIRDHVSQQWENLKNIEAVEVALRRWVNE